MPPVTCRAVAEHIENLSYNVRSFRFKLVDPPKLAFQAGQFMIINVPQDGKVVKRAYSIASAPYDPMALELCIQHLEGGAASTYLWQLKEGAEVTLSGPHGRFVVKEPLDYDPVFVATGTGVAPLRAMIRDLLHKNVTRDIWLLFGCRYEHAILYESEFRSLASVKRNFHYIPTVSRPKEWQGEVGYVQQLFKKHITEFANKEMYLCGFEKILKSVVEDLRSFGVPNEKLHYEEWG